MPKLPISFWDFLGDSWSSVAPSETVTFNQPGVTSATLNRAIGNEQSVINGALNASMRSGCSVERLT